MIKTLTVKEACETSPQLMGKVVRVSGFYVLRDNARLLQDDSFEARSGVAVLLPQRRRITYALDPAIGCWLAGPFAQAAHAVVTGELAVSPDPAYPVALINVNHIEAQDIDGRWHGVAIDK